jgi:ketopantoate reductase
VCIKAFQLTELCQTLAQHDTSERPIILIMNGMGLVEIAIHALPNSAIFQASFVQSSLLNAAALIHTDNGTTYIGNLLELGLDQTLEKNDNVNLILTYLNHALPKGH